MLAFFSKEPIVTYYLLLSTIIKVEINISINYIEKSIPFVLCEFELFTFNENFHFRSRLHRLKGYR